MLKNYNPEEMRGCTHTVEATYMFGEGKVIVRTPIESECAGADLLSLCVVDSDWVSELDGFGEFKDIKLEGIDKLDYDADLDMLTLTYNSGCQRDIDGSAVKDYLVKIEIEAVKAEKDEE